MLNHIDVQTEYWNGAAASKTFTHPLPLAVFRELLCPAAWILDYGCGYGRTCSELTKAGYRNLVGIDIAEEMIKRGRLSHRGLDLRVFDGNSTGFENGSFDACLLLAVLTCIPSDAGQEHTVREVRRLLRPGGIVFISDYPLQTDARNKQRYQDCEKELGTYGMFRTEGAIVRHHDLKHIRQLLLGFDIVWQDHLRVCTMNGNESDVFQFLARKSGG